MVIKEYKPFLYVSQNDPDKEESKYTKEVKQIFETIFQSNNSQVNPWLIALGISHPFLFLPMGIVWLFNQAAAEENRNKMLQEAVEAWKLRVLAISYSSIEEEDIVLLPRGYNVRSNSLYQQHPLRSKRNVYLPLKSYYQMIFKDRELEFIDIMAQLGASEIIITEVNSSGDNISMEESTAFSSSASMRGSHLLSMGYTALNNSTEVSTSSKNKQYIRKLFKTYQGKPWSNNLKIDSSNYTWLDYDDNWQRIVKDRLIHKQTSTKTWITSDIYNIASNAKSSDLDFGLQGNVGNEFTQSLGEVSAEVGIKQTRKKNYSDLHRFFETHSIEICFEKENYQTRRGRVYI